MVKKILSVRKYKAGYEIREELIDGSDYGGKDFVMKSAYTPSGDYIGSSKDAYVLCVKHGIKPEKAKKDHNTCSVGYSEKYQKYCGWSHRCLIAFGIGDKIYEEKFGNENTKFTKHGNLTIRNLNDMKQAAINFAGSVS